MSMFGICYGGWWLPFSMLFIYDGEWWCLDVLSKTLIFQKAEINIGEGNDSLILLKAFDCNEMIFFFFFVFFRFILLTSMR